jgi:CHAT domain-containing protein
VVVADGALQYVPFAALPVPAAGKRHAGTLLPLIAENEVVTAPSASAIAVLRRELDGRTPAPKMVAVIADPVYDRSDPRISAAGNPAATYRAASANAGERSVSYALERSWNDVTFANGNGGKISRLPFSRREAAAIIAAAPHGSSFEALGFRANRATVTSARLAEYRYIHFATHGILDSRTPAFSGLVFSLVDEKGRPEDGFLRLWDIYNLHLPAELVVLSSCQTGLGKEIAGEGLVGLTRGFFYAGAARVIASLWKVDDLATAELMARLYSSMLHKGLSPAAALRSAQVAIWKQKRWEGDPYFWAAFQLQGEWH